MENSNTHQDSICKILSRDKGTGFYIGNDLILTAAHVVRKSRKENEQIHISFINDLTEEHEVEIVQFEGELDLAILKLKEELNIDPLTLLKCPIHSEEKWYSFGFPNTESGQLGGENLMGTITRPRPNDLSDFDTDLRCNDFNPSTEYSGFSGAPVFDENGNVFAILLWQLHRCLGAISIEKVYSFLKQNDIPVEIDPEKYDNKPLSRNWFLEHSKGIISNAGPRYTREANVELDYNKYFNALARNKDFEEQVTGLFEEIKKRSQDIKFYGEGGNDITSIQTNIENALEELWKEYFEIFSVPIDQSIKWDTISEVCSNCYKVIDEQYFKLIDLGKGEEKNSKYSNQEHYLRELLSLILKLRDYSDGLVAELSNTPFLLLKGKAGQGKTHLLCDISVERIALGIPTLMIFGQHFNLSDPWGQILSLLELKEYSKKAFLEQLNELGKEKNKRCLIVVDALNEGAGKELWKNHIARFIADIKEYPWIGLVVSVRSPFDEHIIEKNLIDEKTILELPHRGFEGQIYGAVKEYFNYYKIELFSVPILDTEFSNPLFLKTFCQAFSQKGYHRLPKGAQKFSAVFDLFIEQKNIAICEKIDEDPKLNPLSLSLKKFAELFLKERSRSALRPKAHKLCQEIVVARGWSNSLLFHMISEGVLLESMQFDELSNNWVDSVEFAYERFGDFLKGNYLLNFFTEESFESEDFKHVFTEDKLWYYQTEIQALSILVPERFGKELYEYFPEVKSHDIIVQSFFESLIWRKYEAINEEKNDVYRKSLGENGVDYHSLFLNVLLTVASDPEHIYNASYLHKVLWDLSIAERDYKWTIPIFNWYQDNSIIDSYVEWAWSEDDKTHISDEALLLSATILSWFLTTSNRFLRDDVTKALVKLLKNRTTTLVDLLEKFHNVNDLYVSERLYAVAYGCTMLNSDLEAVKIIAQKVYDLVFAENNPPIHFLLRDYARNCIERALHLNIELNITVDNIRPPYNSDWVEAISEEEAKKYGFEDKKELSQIEWTKSHMIDSITGFEDFSRYIIGTNTGSTNWTNNNVREQQSYVEFKASLNRKNKELFNAYEKMLKYESFFKDQLETGNDLLSPELITSLENDIEKFKSNLLDSLDGEKQTLFNQSINQYLISNSTKKADDNQSFDLSILQRLILKKVFDLGWSIERFGQFDTYIRRSSGIGRETNKKERIGKKYQWIALHEFLARLTDNFEYKVQFNQDGYSICQGPWHDKFRRDIDPSILIRSNKNIPLPQFKDVFQIDASINSSLTDEEWMTQDDNIPRIHELIQIADNNGNIWMKLEGNFNWREEKLFGEDEYGTPKKNIWIQLRSYIVKKSKKKAFFQWAKEQDFMGRWMPESSDRYEYFLGESYWAPAFEYTRQPYYSYEETYNPSYQKTEGKVSAKIRVTAENFLKESGDYDCSMDEGLSITLPSSFIAKSMKLNFGEREGYLYDETGGIVAFDPSVWDEGNKGLLINKQKFQDFLGENDLDVVFTILGEKQITGDWNNPSSLGRVEISGAYTIDSEGKINGDFTLRRK